MKLRKTIRRRPLRYPPGFTLVELLVVVSVISTLLAILVPSLGKAREDARRTVCLANLKHIGVGLFTYSSANRDLGPAIMAPLGFRAPRSLLSTSEGLVNLGLMLPEDVADPNLFYCPSQKRFNHASDPNLLGEELVDGSYAYAVQLPATQSPKFAKFRHLAMVSDDFTRIYGADGVGRYAHRTVYNVLYTDGSGARYDDPDESIWKQRVYWDNEYDDYDYSTYYGDMSKEGEDGGSYGYYADIFRVWHAFCYSQPDPFGAAASAP
jgi:prepilin-type N-terminal cleavage/methylation domain-containing protein